MSDETNRKRSLIPDEQTPSRNVHLNRPILLKRRQETSIKFDEKRSTQKILPLKIVQNDKATVEEKRYDSNASNYPYRIPTRMSLSPIQTRQSKLPELTLRSNISSRRTSSLSSNSLAILPDVRDSQREPFLSARNSSQSKLLPFPRKEQ